MKSCNRFQTFLDTLTIVVGVFECASFRGASLMVFHDSPPTNQENEIPFQLETFFTADISRDASDWLNKPRVIIIQKQTGVIQDTSNENSTLKQ